MGSTRRGDSRTRAGGSGSTRGVGPGAAIPGGGPGHSAQAGQGGADHARESGRVARPRVGGGRGGGTASSRSACRVVGWRADELLGRDWSDTCVPARMRGEWRGKFQRLIAGDLSIAESPILTKSREERLGRGA